MVPSVIGLIRKVDDDAGALVVTLEDGRVIRFGREAAQLGEQPPREGVLLLAGEDAQGQWLMPVLGYEEVFVFHGTGYDEGRRIVVRPDPPAIPSGAGGLVSLAKAAGFSGGSHEERGIYDSPTGTFALDPRGAVTGNQP